MAIKKIKLPDNTTEDINDPRLPVVTTTDNGKVLSVSGGIWSANSKPSYTLDEVSDGSTRKLANYVTLADTETITGLKTFTAGPIIFKYTNPRIVLQAADGTTHGIFAARTAGTPEFYNGSLWSTIYHSGNSNKSDVNWTANQVYANAGVNVYGSSNFGRYAITCATTSTNGTHGSVTGDFAMYTTMFRATTSSARGWIWRAITNNTYANVASIDCNGNLAASGTITPSSDSRIKDEQQEIDGKEALEIIERLTPKTWVWNEKTGNSGKKAAGLVAQDVVDVIPEAVSVGSGCEFDDLHFLNYNTIQGYEIAAIKGLIGEVKSLKAEIAELKKQIK